LAQATCGVAVTATGVEYSRWPSDPISAMHNAAHARICVGLATLVSFTTATDETATGGKGEVAESLDLRFVFILAILAFGTLVSGWVTGRGRAGAFAEQLERIRRGSRAEENLHPSCHPYGKVAGVGLETDGGVDEECSSATKSPAADAEQAADCPIDLRKGLAGDNGSVLMTDSDTASDDGENDIGYLDAAVQGHDISRLKQNLSAPVRPKDIPWSYIDKDGTGCSPVSLEGEPEPWLPASLRSKAFPRSQELSRDSSKCSSSCNRSLCGREDAVDLSVNPSSWAPFPLPRHMEAEEEDPVSGLTELRL